MFGWLERARPHLFVLTAGSRNGDRGRLAYTELLAQQAGICLGPLFGSFLDREVYEAFLTHDAALFSRWTADLTDALAALDPSLVVMDSWQMYNPCHDIVHVMARVAVGRATQRLGHSVDVVEYEVVPPQLAAPRIWGREAFRIELDDNCVARKQSAALDYPDLRGEVMQLLALRDSDASRTEIYRHPVDLDALAPPDGVEPPYERHGAERIAAGTYRECIRWNDHVRPVVEAIRSS